MKYRMGLSDSNPNKNRSLRPSSRPLRKSITYGGKDLSHSRGASATSSNRKMGAGLKFISNFRSKFTLLGRGGKPKSEKKGVTTLSRGKRIKKALVRAFVITTGLGFVTVIVLLIALGLYLRSLQDSLPDPNRLIEWKSSQSTIIYDRNGKELYKIRGDEDREFVSIDEYPEYTKWALLAAEDADFYQHKGLDWKGIIGCSISSTRAYFSGGSSGKVCGASTITQQLVRKTIVFELDGDAAYERRTFTGSAKRKIKELLISMQVERSLTKDEILQLYMNEVSLGGVNYGYGAAAKDYFGKEAKDLTLAESALLAGLLPSPTNYSPLYGDKNLAFERQGYVLDELTELTEKSGVTLEDIEAARNEELVFESAAIDIDAYHWVFYVKQQLEEQYGQDTVQKGGLKVTTTLDFSTQTIAEEEIRSGVETYIHKHGGYNGGMVVLDPNTNQILAMVGSVDPNKRDDPRIDGAVNVTTSLQQVGSSFKPYVYFAAMQQYGPWVQTADIEYNFGNYRPKNWDGFTYYGNMSAREALVLSRNLPAIYSQQLAGTENVVKNLEMSGVTTLTDPDTYGLSMAIGSAEMKLTEHAQAYSVFATGGIKRDLVSILKVEDSNGNILQEWKATEGERIFDEKDVYLLNWMLCDLGGFGDQVGARFGYYNIDGVRATCGKTGTTDGPVDLVDVLYHKNLLVAVWLGNNNNELMPGAWSTEIALPLAHNFAQRVASKYPPELYSRPAGVIEAQICDDTGMLADPETECEKVKTVYVQGRAPKKDERKKIDICKDKRAIPSNLTQAKALGVTVEKIQLNYVIENPNQKEAFEKYMSELPDSRYIFGEIPTEACTLPLGPGGAPIIDMSSPSVNSSYNVGDIVKIAGNIRIEEGEPTLKIFFDAAEIGTATFTNFTLDYKIPVGTTAGTHIIKVEVVDSKGRTAMSTVAIKVNIDATNSKVEVTDPVGGSKITVLPASIKANVTGVTASRVTFEILKPSDPTYVKSYTDNKASDGWSVSWIDPTATDGIYTIKAYAIVEGVAVLESEVITVELDLAVWD